MAKKGLGRGLGALIQSADTDDNAIKDIGINEIEPNVEQPRKKFDDEKMLKLAESVKQHGIVQPIIVKREGQIYRIIAGERRWRAARLAELASVPAIIKDMSGREAMEIALIENLQREDLNPIEEAEAFDRLIKDFEMTQEEISIVVGRSRPSVANSLRLLNLNDKVKEYIISGDITSGHGRALIPIENSTLQQKLAKEVVDKKLNVRDTEKLVKRYIDSKKTSKPKKLNENILEIEEKFKNIFGTKVKLFDKNKKGRIVIEYYSYDELDRIIELVEKIGGK